MEPDARPSFIAIARIARARGIKGEVLADLYTDFPERFDGLEEVWLEYANGRRQRMAVEDAWRYKGRIVLKFAGIDDMSAAQLLAGCWVQVPVDQAMPLPEGTYYDHDLIGCSVEDTRGEAIGIVEEILRIADNSLLVVRNERRECLVPAVESICIRISLEEKRIVIDPPEGLLDLGK